jgi:hypothetical protein
MKPMSSPLPTPPPHTHMLYCCRCLSSPRISNHALTLAPLWWCGIHNGVQCIVACGDQDGPRGPCDGLPAPHNHLQAPVPGSGAVGDGDGGLLQQLSVLLRVHEHVGCLVAGG